VTQGATARTLAAALAAGTALALAGCGGDGGSGPKPFEPGADTAPGAPGANAAPGASRPHRKRPAHVRGGLPPRPTKREKPRSRRDCLRIARELQRRGGDFELRERLQTLGCGTLTH
jgi:hypothetical protein